MKITDNAITVLQKRYFKEGEDWDKLVRRVVNAITNNDQLREAYYNAIFNLEILPNTPTLVNAGTSMQQLSACYVLPVEDNIPSIFDAVKHAAMIHKSGGGTGFSFSKLREANSAVNTTNGVSSGPVSFMRVFNEATGAIKQGGVRRGANMGILNIDHPDIEEFIKCKADTTQLTNFNISVGITDKFMEAVNADEDFDLISPSTGQTVKTVKAKYLLDMIASYAHKNGEPGIIFLDRINRDNPTPHLGDIAATNPCGEIPLLPNEACTLASINLNAVIKDKQIMWEKLDQLTRIGVLMLNDIIDVNQFPLPEIAEAVKATRKIGLGVMGWADVLLKMGVPYGSDESYVLALEIMERIQYQAMQTSQELVRYFGAYPECNNVKRRNATVTCIAPTGTISMIAGCSSGIEPIFSLSYTKNVMDGEEIVYINEYLKADLEALDLWNSKVEREVRKTGSIQHLDLPSDIKQVYRTAQEIEWSEHIRMQACFQQYCDNAVSKTINMSKDATLDDVGNAYRFAWRSNLKGITVYRDGSRESQVLSIGYKPKDIKYSKCPECSSQIEHAEGCVTCKNCGWAVCS